ncbi:MAG: hypothetical protein ACRESI_06455 [Gammaproteobacteria bacterium]
MDALKTPVSRTLANFVDDRIATAFDSLGKFLPAIVTAVDGAIVTVAFQLSDVTLPAIKMPVAGSEYVRLPIQVGCKGVCFSADVPIGSISGLGSNAAPSSVRAGNLTGLVFFPVGNANWAAVSADVLTLYGVSGLTLQDAASPESTVQLTSSSITLTSNGHVLSINSTGITLDGLVFLDHTHSGVTSGAEVSGPVVP